MIKNMQIKIAVLFLVLGLIIIGSISAVYIYQLQELNNIVIQNAEIANNNIELTNIITEKINSVKLISGIFMIAYSAISIVISIIAIKKINKPISNYMKNFELDSNEMKSKNNYLIERKQTKQSNEFVSAIQLITTELNEDLNNIKEQKKQIETILVHLTDHIL